MPITVYLRWAEADGVIFNSVPLDSAQWASNPGPPCSRSWQAHHTTVGFLPSAGKSRAGPEPGCHDPNPQLAECSATGKRSVLTWETFPWTQATPKNRPESAANVAKYSAKPEISVFSTFPTLGFLFCQTPKPGIDLSADIFRIAKLKRQLWP